MAVGALGPEAFPEISNAWKSACRVLLGREVGSLAESEGYLQRFAEPPEFAESSLSGKEIAITGQYPEGARFVSFEEARASPFCGKVELNINEIKDIDSIAESLSGHVFYSGGNLLGNSGHSYLSNRVVDSNYLYKSHIVFYSQYVACCFMVKYCERVFGTSGGKSKFAVNCHEVYEVLRGMELLRVYTSSDCYYCANLENCQDCLFSFNLRSKRRCIGNLELPASKYDVLREKLKCEIADSLQPGEKALSIIDIVSAGGIK